MLLYTIALRFVSIFSLHFSITLIILDTSYIALQITIDVVWSDIVKPCM